MPVPEGGVETDNRRLVRVARVVRGQMRLVCECALRFDYGRAEHALEITADGAVFRAREQPLTVPTTDPLTWDPAVVRGQGPHGDAIPWDE